jgi:hypothetical protein
MHDVTLQFNLNQGDVSFLFQSIPPLVQAHRRNIDEVVAIVDCCRPQSGPVTVGEGDSLESEYRQRTEETCAIARNLKQQGYLDKIIYLHKDDPILSVIYRKYLNNLIRQTHDSTGTALAAYLLALETCGSRYLIHYDADILLYQAPDYDWTVEAKNFMSAEPMAIDVSPRISPPFAEYKHLADAPSVKWGKPEGPGEGYWYSNWFSSRCFLLDRQKLFSYLPLVKGNRIELLARKFLRRNYPWNFEMLLSRRMKLVGGRRLVLKSRQAWILHPKDRDHRYLNVLPRMQKAITEGRLPLEQRGQEGIDICAWEGFLANT